MDGFNVAGAIAAGVAGVLVFAGSAVGTVVLLIQHDRRRVARQRAQQVNR